MAENETGTFSVLAADERLPDFSTLSRIIAESRGMNLDDAGRAARHAWGFIGEGVDEAGAAAVLERCALYGVNAATIPAAMIPILPAPIPIKKAVFTVGSFDYTGGGAFAGHGSPEEILVLAAAPFKEEKTKTVKTTEGPSGQEKAIRLGIMAVTGLPIGLGKSRGVKKEVKSSEISFCMDIILRTGKIRLRLNSDNFDFSCLMEKKTYSSQTNFRLICSELAAFSPHALKNAGLLAILEGKPLTLLPYDTADDFEKETLRLAALAVRRQL